MKTIIWEVQYFSPPEVVHYCKKCSKKTTHISSGLFRVNAQAKQLDIWLVYRCTHCKSTWNLPVLSRVNTKHLSPKLLCKFMNNDANLAMQYGMDIHLLKEYGAEAKTPIYEIVGDAISGTQPVKVKIVSPYNTNIRLTKMIREKLSLSHKEFDRQVLAGNIYLEHNVDIYKCRVQKETIVYIHLSCQ